MLKNYVRTDLALELKEDIPEEEKMDGIHVETVEVAQSKIKKTHIRILNEKGSRQLGKPVGNYITLESEKLSEEDETIHMPFVQALHDVLEHLLQGSEKVFVIGLGNRNITPDALGPMVVDHLYITRHLLKEGVIKKSMELSALCPGVMAQTGIESGQIIQALCRELKPEKVICIDALAAREMERLGTTIQICDTGITPGAGVGNRRVTLNEETLGIPVIAIGVPTVISTSSIVGHAMEYMLDAVPAVGQQMYEDVVANYIKSPMITSMFVTPKDIDETVHRVSYTIAEAINRLLL